MSKTKTSPCVDVCRYPGQKGWCIACGLTSKESRNWKAMKPYDRTRVRKQLSKRKAALQAKGLLWTGDDA